MGLARRSGLTIGHSGMTRSGQSGQGNIGSAGACTFARILMPSLHSVGSRSSAIRQTPLAFVGLTGSLALVFENGSVRGAGVDLLGDFDIRRRQRQLRVQEALRLWPSGPATAETTWTRRRTSGSRETGAAADGANGSGSSPKQDDCGARTDSRRVSARRSGATSVTCSARQPARFPCADDAVPSNAPTTTVLAAPLPKTATTRTATVSLLRPQASSPARHDGRLAASAQEDCFFFWLGSNRNS
jgi:hypothetical protein